VVGGLRSRLPTVLAVALQGLLFGAAHVDPVRGAGNVGLVVVLSSVGIAFGVAAHLLRRLGPSIVAHALFNGVVLLVVLTGVADRLQNEGSASEEVGVVDQPYVAEADRDGDPVSTRQSIRLLDIGHRGERGCVEDAHVVE
jgi:Type II CAAX prenyl endopeptidase Rce1-like